MKALHWLFINSELWKNADIEINANCFSQNGSTDHQGTDAFQETEDSHETTDACNSADGDHEDIDTLRHQTHCSCPGIPDDHDSCHHSDHDSSNDESDHFSEVDDLQLSGNLESLLDGDISSEHLLTFAPGEGQQPLGLFQDKDSEYLAFPTIYCGQHHLDNKDRVTKVHYSDICKWEARSVDRRVAQCVPNLFFKMKKLAIKHVADRANFAMRRYKTKGRHYTAADMLSDTIRENLVHLDEGYYIFRSLRNSPPYMQKRKKDVFAMIRQLGLPTWFMSLSAADTRWKNLLKVLAQFLDGKLYSDQDIDALDWNEKTRLVQNDPVTCARYFDHRVQQFIKIVLKSRSNPLGDVADFFYRVEFQHRGSPHIHMLLWTKDAPRYGLTDNQHIIAYIDKHVSCSEATDLLHKAIVDLQKHKHSRTCRKRGKASCRFGYPMPPMPETQILTPLNNAQEQSKCKENYDMLTKKLEALDAETDITFQQFLQSTELTQEEYMQAVRSTLNSPKVFLARKPSEARINAYMKFVADAWQANHDVQFVLDSYACATYIVSYINKQEKGMSALLDKACKEARQGNMDLKHRIRHMGNKFLNGVEISAQEAAFLILQLPLTKASREVVFINTSPPEERTFLLKDRESLESLPASSTNIEASNIIEIYSKRPKQLDSWCLADFAPQLQIKYLTSSKSKTEYQSPLLNEADESSSGEDDATVFSVDITLTNGTTYKSRKNPRVIRYVRFNRQIDEEKHYRELLMLFMPWRNEDADLNGCASYKESFQLVEETVTTKRAQYEHNAEAIETAAQSSR